MYKLINIYVVNGGSNVKKGRKLRKALKKRVRPVLLLVVFSIVAMTIPFIAEAQWKLEGMNEDKSIGKETTTFTGKDSKDAPGNEKNFDFTGNIEVLEDDLYKINIKIGGEKKAKADVVIAIDEGTTSSYIIRSIKQCVKEFCTKLVIDNGDNIRIALIGSGTKVNAKGNKLVDSRVLIDSEVTNNEFNWNIDVLDKNMEKLSFGKITNTQAAIFRIGELLDKSKEERPNAERYAICINTKLPYVSDGIRSDLNIHFDKFIKSAQLEYNKVIGGIRFVGGIGDSGERYGWDNNIVEDDNYLNGRHKDTKFYSIGMIGGMADIKPLSPETKFLSTIQNVVPKESDENRIKFFDKYMTGQKDELLVMINDIAGEIDSNIEAIIAKNAILSETLSADFKFPADIKLQGISDKDVSIEGNNISINLNDINAKGKEISFIVEAVDPYYSNNNVEVIDTAELVFDDPNDKVRKTIKPTINNVTINPKLAEISIIESGIPKTIMSLTKKDNGVSKNKYNFELYDGERIDMKVRLLDESTKVLRDDGQLIGTILCGKYLVSQLLPMDYEEVEAKYSYDDINWYDIEADTLISIDKNHRKINLKLDNKFLNSGCWKDRSDTSSTFKYSSIND